MHAAPLTCLFAALTLLTGGARACGPYEVALYDFGRLHWRDADGHSRGIDVDVVQALAQRSGCTLTTAVDSRARIWDRLNHGRLALTTSGLATPERERLAEFWPYLKTRNRALLRRDVARKMPTADAFLADKSRRVVVVRSFKHGPTLDALLDQLRAENRVSEVADFDVALRLLLAGKVDLLFAQPLILAGRTDAGLQDTVMLDWAPRDDVVANMVASRQGVDAEHRQQLRRALKSLVRDGSVEAIIRRHVSPQLARDSALVLPH